MHRSGNIVFLVVFVLVSQLLPAQTTSKKENRCVRLDGKDGYIKFGDIYRDLKLPFSISAWVNIDRSNIDLCPVFANRNCVKVYSGFMLTVDRNYISIQYGDGFGMKHHAYRRGKEATVTLPHGEWHHVTAVVTDNANIELYLDGKNVGGEISGSSTQPMDSSDPNGFATAGYIISNNVELHYKGAMDDVRLWNRALSPEDVAASLCNTLTGKEPGLIGNWTFDETSGSICNDKSPNKFAGKLVGSAKREPATISCVK